MVFSISYAPCRFGCVAERKLISPTKLKTISTFCTRFPSTFSGAWTMIFLINSLTIAGMSSVMVRGGQADPDHLVSVTFHVGGRTMRVNNVYYPSGDSQLVWIRWTTPSTPQVMEITVSATGRGHAEKSVITANIVDLDQNPPPDPQADDRNDRPSSVIAITCNV